MTYKVMIIFITSGFFFTNTKSLQFKKEVRDPFAWIEEETKQEVAKVVIPEPVKPEKPKHPTCTIQGIAIGKHESYALIHDRKSSYIVTKGSSVEKGWKVVSITQKQVQYEHNTGERWIISLSTAL